MASAAGWLPGREGVYREQAVSAVACSPEQGLSRRHSADIAVGHATLAENRNKTSIRPLQLMNYRINCCEKVGSKVDILRN